VRIACEHIPEQNRILVRLLGTAGDPDQSISPTYVQTGLYLVDATPLVNGIIRFNITTSQIVNNEAKIYLTGFFPLPDQIRSRFPTSPSKW